MRQEMFARGILFLSTHNLCYSHGDEDIARLLAAHDEVLPLVRTAVREKKLHDLLRCQPLKPLFAVR
jgi:glutamate-1-semialdehyde 2,1-aminomutase